MHNTVMIVVDAQRVDLVFAKFIKIILLTLPEYYGHFTNIDVNKYDGNWCGYYLPTFHYVLVDDCHILISIWSGMFMPKADHMSQFMYDNSKLITILSD